MTNAKMAARIRKLLDLAEHPNTPEAERLSASEKAAELMETYAIDELMARADHGKADAIIKREYTEGGSYWQALKGMYLSLAEALGMRGLYYQPAPYEKVVLRMVVYGFEADFVKYDALVTSMKLQCESAWKLFRAGLDIPNDTVFVTTKRSFMLGYGAGFAKRVEAGRNHAVEEAGSGTELVLVDRSKRVEAFVNEAHQDVKKAAALKINSAYHYGRSAGAQANTGESSIGNRGELR